MVGEPMGPAVGTVLFQGLDLPEEGATPKSVESECKRWIHQQTPVWNKLKIEKLRWSLSEEWERFVDSWRQVFDNEEYVDVEQLVRLEREAFLAGQKIQPIQDQV